MLVPRVVCGTRGLWSRNAAPSPKFHFYIYCSKIKRLKALRGRTLKRIGMLLSHVCEKEEIRVELVRPVPLVAPNSRSLSKPSKTSSTSMSSRQPLLTAATSLPPLSAPSLRRVPSSAGQVCGDKRGVMPRNAASMVAEAGMHRPPGSQDGRRSTMGGDFGSVATCPAVAWKA